jgi:hypothetical protein
LSEQLQHLRGPTALAAIFAATAAATAHRHLYPASAADCDAYADGHAGCWQPHPNTDRRAHPNTHIHRYQRTRDHADIHRHSSGAADGYADAATAAPDGDTHTAATTANRYANAAAAAPYGYADTAATTANGYTTTNRHTTTTANRYAATADQHTCSVSHPDSGRWLTPADISILEFRIEKPPAGRTCRRFD